MKTEDGKLEVEIEKFGIGEPLVKTGLMNESKYQESFDTRKEDVLSQL